MLAHRFAVCLTLAFVAECASPAFAFQPQVIPGIGPENYAMADQQSQPSYGEPALRPLPRPHINYGGGLLEALVGPDRSEAQPSSARLGYLPAQPEAYGSPQPGYAPESYAVQPQKMVDPVFQRQEVAFDGAQPSGTIVIDTSRKFLYLVQGRGTALRYGIGVGRPGFIWHGSKAITRMAEWPDWTPPSEMLQRRPDLPRHMEGGMANPLGARAMYLGSSLYRIHGTNEPETIGTNVSSGCIRLTNDDVADLYSRVRVGTRVIVM